MIKQRSDAFVSEIRDSNPDDKTVVADRKSGVRESIRGWPDDSTHHFKNLTEIVCPKQDVSEEDQQEGRGP